MSYNISRLFQFFLPKDIKFFPLLSAQIGDLKAGADILVAFTQTSDHEEHKRMYAELKTIETHCDRVTEAILDELNKSFITPFDREDIQTLASQLDDVLDLINASAKRTVLYFPREMPKAMSDMAGFIRDCVHNLDIAVNELEKVRRDQSVVRSACRMLHELENTADDVYENYIRTLFKDEKDAIELIKQVEIIQLLEKAVDKAYRVTDVLKTIIVKYA